MGHDGIAGLSGGERVDNIIKTGIACSVAEPDIRRDEDDIVEIADGNGSHIGSPFDMGGCVSC